MPNEGKQSEGRHPVYRESPPNQHAGAQIAAAGWGAQPLHSLPWAAKPTDTHLSYSSSCNSERPGTWPKQPAAAPVAAPPRRPASSASVRSQPGTQLAATRGCAPSSRLYRALQVRALGSPEQLASSAAGLEGQPADAPWRHRSRSPLSLASTCCIPCHAHCRCPAFPHYLQGGLGVTG